MTRSRVWAWLQPSPATRSREQRRAELEQLLFRIGESDEVKLAAGVVAYVRRQIESE